MQPAGDGQLHDGGQRHGYARLGSRARHGLPEQRRYAGLRPRPDEPTIAVQVIGDTTPEPDETFTLALPGPTNATIARGIAVGAIVDGDGAVSLDSSGNLYQNTGTGQNCSIRSQCG
jgi:hypothetical protein